MTPTAVSTNVHQYHPSHIFSAPEKTFVERTGSKPLKVLYARFLSPAPTIRKSLKHSLPLSELTDRHTLRTYMVGSEGTIVDAQIDLNTAEVTPHKYASFPVRAKPRAKLEPSDVLPSWMRIPAPQYVIRTPDQDISRKQLANGLKMYLDGYQTVDEAIENLPLLDNLIVGATELEMKGSTRKLNRGILFAMLQQLDYITPKTVQDFMDCSVRHSQRVAQCLRVIVRAFEAEADRKLSTGTDANAT